MTFSDRHVIVKEIPQSCDAVGIKAFLRDFSFQIANEVRPAVVLDCSPLGRIDRNTLQLLLSCLEEAMKRSGDVRLAALHPDAWAVLKIAGIERLFQRFLTVADAIDSYRRPQFDRGAFPAGPAPDEAEASAA